MRTYAAPCTSQGAVPRIRRQRVTTRRAILAVPIPPSPSARVNSALGSSATFLAPRYRLLRLLGHGGPIMETCACVACSQWSVGVLAALFQAREPLAYRLASVHNLTLLNGVLQDVRTSVRYTG